jgi:hypothetical protein
MNIVSGHVTRVSLKTATVCLDRLSVFANGASAGTNFYAPSSVRDGTIAIDQLIEIALKHALEMKLVRLDWQELQAAVSADPILLLLRNQNVVVAVRAATNATDQIVVFDPLYREGEDFLLPRQMLEAAWDGDAILVQQRPVTPKRWAGFGSALVFLCAVTAAVGLVLFYPTEGGNENFVFTATQHAASSEPLPSGGKSSSITEARSHIPAQAPIPDAEMAPASDSTNPFVVLIPPPTPGARSPGPNAMKEPVRPNSDTATVVLKPAGPAAVPASAPKPKKDAVTTVAPNSDTATVVLRPAGPAAAPASAPKPKKDALTTAAPNSDTATVVSKPPGTGAPASAPETDALTASVPANSEPTISKPADSAAAPPNAPETGALTTQVAPNSDVGQVPAVAPKPRKLVSSAEISALVARGDALFGTGDLTSARLLYERAADAGYGPAALRLGESYDPSFPALNRMAIRGDAALAARWYRRAHELGVADAEILLNALQR